MGCRFSLTSLDTVVRIGVVAVSMSTVAEIVVSDPDISRTRTDGLINYNAWHGSLTVMA